MDAEPTVSEDERRFRDAVLARHTALEFGNYYDCLGVDVDTSAKKVRAAYEEVVASLEPQSAFRDRIGDIETKLANVRRKVREGLRSPERRRNSVAVRTELREYVARVDARGPHRVRPYTDDSRTDWAQTLVPGSSPKRKEQAELLFLEAKRLYNDRRLLRRHRISQRSTESGSQQWSVQSTPRPMARAETPVAGKRRRSTSNAPSSSTPKTWKRTSASQRFTKKRARKIRLPRSTSTSSPSTQTTESHSKNSSTARAKLASWPMPDGRWPMADGESMLDDRIPLLDTHGIGRLPCTRSRQQKLP